MSFEVKTILINISANISAQFTKKHVQEIFVRWLAVIGGVKTLFEVIDFFLDGKSVVFIDCVKEFISSNFFLFGLLLLIVLFLFYRRKLSFSWPIANSDLEVEISFCDIFKQEGLKVIHVMDTFDMELSKPGLIDKKTVHGKFLIKASSNDDTLQLLIQKIRDGLKNYAHSHNDNLPANKDYYEIGTAVMVNISNENYAIVAFSKMQADMRVVMPQNEEEYSDFLVKMWQNLYRQSTSDDIVNVTIFGDGLNRMPANFTKEKKIREIISSFVACSNGTGYKKLRICLKLEKESSKKIEKYYYLKYLYSSLDTPVNNDIIGNHI